MISTQYRRVDNGTRSHRITTPGERPRIEAGRSLKEVAKQLRVTPKYLRQIERHGGASLKIARKLARLYGCSGDIFLYPPKYFTTGHEDNSAVPLPSPARGADTISRGAARRYRKPSTPLLTLVSSRGVRE